MSKIRVYELAKELQISSKELIELLMSEFSVDVKNHMSVIEDEDAELIKELLANEASGEGKTIVDEYEDKIAEEVNNQAKKKKKRKNDEDKVGVIGEGGSGVVEIGETITVKELAEKLGKPTNDVIRTLIFLGVMAGINQEIDFVTDNSFKSLSQTKDKLYFNYNITVPTNNLDKYYELSNHSIVLDSLVINMQIAVFQFIMFAH